MPTYVVLLHFTEQGAKNVKGTVDRVRAVRAENERRGMKMQAFYWTQGQYDAVAVIEAPDEETMLAASFNIGAAGNARSTTLRAFTEGEVESILKKM